MFILSLEILEICNNPSFPGNISTKAPNCNILVTFPKYTSFNSTSLVNDSIMLIALSSFSWSTPATYTVPSSSISIFTPVSSIILFIVFPPAPITSLILSGFILIT